MLISVFATSLSFFMLGITINHRSLQNMVVAQIKSKMGIKVSLLVIMEV